MKNYIDKPDILKWDINNILLIMRLTTVILMISMFQVSASTVAKEFNYVSNEASLVKIFKEIRKQPSYNIILNEKEIGVTATINVNFKNATNHDVLNKSLSNLPLTYSINDKMVMIKEDMFSFREKLADFYSSIDVRGKVVDENNAPLVGAVVKVKGTKKATSTNNNGEFVLNNVDESSILAISHVGYEPQEIVASNNIGTIKLKLSTDKLEEVDIVSTGYQTIPKERITGSFTVVDNKLINRGVSPGLLDRLKSVSNGLLIDVPGNSGNRLGISVRGRSTLFSDTKPLIVIDNFPFEGDINSINPNDVENVTLLKDAAAASIWGVRAGNGVIVITTKKGILNLRNTVSFSSNLTLVEKPNLFYTPQLSSAEYIEIEKYLFNKGAYASNLRNKYSLISPVIELLRNRTASNSNSIDAEIEALKLIDSRDQIGKFFFRNGVLQQYYLNYAGSGINNTYNISGGYDRNAMSAIGSSSNRYTFKANNSYQFLKSRLELNTDLTLNSNLNNNDNSRLYTNSSYPYERIADENNSPLSVLNTGGLRSSYTDTAGNGKLLSWKYKPLEELRTKANTIKNEAVDIRLNANINYKIIRPLSVSLYYQYYRSQGSTEAISDLNSFGVRNSVNEVTQINSITGAVKHPFPKGSIFGRSNNILKYQYGRGQFNFNDTYFNKHSVNAILGYEIRSEDSYNTSANLYGYDKGTATSLTLDNQTDFPYYHRPGFIRYNSNTNLQFTTTNHFISYYTNFSYVFDNRYVLYGSFRKDQSNLFGVKANQKGVPLWSSGFAWNVNRESFYNFKFLSKLQVKGSYGYNGNVNQSLSALTTATPNNGDNTWNSPYLNITNPPNPKLSWERVRNINLGIEFASTGDRISGNIEYYSKKGVDLIGLSLIAQQTGLSSFTGNVADTKTQGVDIQLNSRNIDNNLKWFTTAFINVAKDKVLNYLPNVNTNSNTVNPLSINPLVGYPIGAIFGYKTGVLDIAGNPQGYLNGSLTKDYTSMINSTNINDLDYYGSRVPTIYGAIRNTLGYKSLELSFNISYKLRYYFRNQVLQNSSLYRGGDYRTAEFENRWKKPGDESFTSVPSLIYPAESTRDAFYAYSANSVSRGDHIRLNDIRVSYSFPSAAIKSLKLDNLEIFAYADNIGILWRANSKNIDPETIRQYPTPRQLSFGIKCNL